MWVTANLSDFITDVTSNTLYYWYQMNSEQCLNWVFKDRWTLERLGIQYSQALAKPAGATTNFALFRLLEALTFSDWHWLASHFCLPVFSRFFSAVILPIKNIHSTDFSPQNNDPHVKAWCLLSNENKLDKRPPFFVAQNSDFYQGLYCVSKWPFWQNKKTTKHRETQTHTHTLYHTV